MARQRRALELYEVLKTDARARTVEPQVRDFMPPADTPVEADDARPEQDVIQQAEQEDIVLPPSASAPLGPRGLVGFDEEPPAPVDGLDDEDDGKLPWVFASEGRLVFMLSYTAVGIAAVSVAVLVLAAFFLGQAAAPGADVTAVAEQTEPFDGIRQAPISYEQVETIPARRRAAERQPAGQARRAKTAERTALASDVSRGGHWELLIATYPRSKRAMADRALKAFEGEGLDGVRLVRSGRNLGLWGPNFPLGQEDAARAFAERVKAKGPELNKLYKLGQVKGFTDCLLRKKTKK